MDMNLGAGWSSVTGANRGIGRGHRRVGGGGGAIVAILARDAEASAQTVEALGADGAFAVSCDVTDGASIVRAVAEVEARHGRIDAVVNNAGRFGGGPIVQLGARPPAKASRPRWSDPRPGPGRLAGPAPL